ncbi:hypothetical protein MRB53_042141 [Persea americana]|nr:hypothetical protein MRB53_042141 [Persea americana]
MEMTARGQNATAVSMVSGIVQPGGGSRDEDVAVGKNKDNDSGEADRALGVVEKKLTGGLSPMATVNELIQQATDERNLAILFCGWAAFA